MNRNNPMEFFQVSINSERLNTFLTTIQRTIKQQQTRIEQISQSFLTQLTQVNENTSKIMTDIKKNEQQIKNMVVTEVLLQKEQLKKTNQKTQILFQTLHQRINSVDTEINKDKKTFEELLQKTQYAFQQCKEIKNIQNTLTNLQIQIDHIKSDKFKQNIKEFIDIAQQEKVNEICQDTFFKIIENDRVREIIQKKQYISSDHKKNKKVPIEQKQAVFFASISNKIDQLQQKLLENHHVELNKVLYPSKNTNSSNGTSNSTNSHTFSSDQPRDSKEQLQKKLAIKGISTKLQSIEQIMNKRLQDLKNQLTKSFEKNQLLNEKLSIFNKKIEKQKSRINELAVEFKKYSERKVDQKIVQSFRYEIRQKSLDYQDNLDGKVSKDLFQKEKIKINERIKIIHENLAEKTDKSQIKKAISFLELKIKELILLVAGNYDQNRQGSIKKTPFKCLSCDKDLDTKLLQLNENYKDKMIVSQLEEGKTMKRSESAAKLRCATSRMRKHIRMNSGAITPVAHIQVQSFGID